MPKINLEFDSEEEFAEYKEDIISKRITDLYSGTLNCFNQDLQFRAFLENNLLDGKIEFHLKLLDKEDVFNIGYYDLKAMTRDEVFTMIRSRCIEMIYKEIKFSNEFVDACKGLANMTEGGY